MTAAIVLHASQATGVPTEAILGRTRSQPVCWIRFAIMAELRGKGLSLSAIGRLMGRHHTTIMSGLEQAFALRTHPGFSKIRKAIG